MRWTKTEGKGRIKRPPPWTSLTIPKRLGQQEGPTGPRYVGELLDSGRREVRRRLRGQRWVRRCGNSDLGSPGGGSGDDPGQRQVCRKQEKPATLNRAPSSWDASV